MDQIKRKEPWNIGLLAHVDSGKTTLTEQMLYMSGSVKKIGRVDEGNAHTDFIKNHAKAKELIILHVEKNMKI